MYMRFLGGDHPQFHRRAVGPKLQNDLFSFSCSTFFFAIYMGVFLKVTCFCFRQAIFSICNYKINGNTSSESAKMNVCLFETGL